MEKSISEILFNKLLNNITFDDIESFFNDEQEENSILEFKSGDTSLEKIYREVCAFLNSDGGLIIIGAPIEKTVAKKKICSGALTNSDFKNKDWLSQKITTNISPTPSGIKVIEREKSGIKIFICEVPRSINPPHQCSSDGIYYIRMEAEAKFAPHGIVMALFNKRKQPEIYIESSIEKYPDNFYINIYIRNRNNVASDNLHYILEAYNVEKTGIIKLEPVGTTDLNKLSNSGVVSTPLIFGIENSIRYWIETSKSKFIYSIMIWSKEVPAIFNFYLVDVRNGEIEFEGDLNSEKDIMDIYEEINNL